MDPRTIMLSAVAGLTVAAGAALATQGVVSQKGKAFNPGQLDQTVGTTLQIPNDDDVPHNVTVQSPDGVVKNTGMQKPGDHVDVKLDSVGEYTIRCGIHPKMKLLVQAR